MKEVRSHVERRSVTKSRHANRRVLKIDSVR